MVVPVGGPYPKDPETKGTVVVPVGSYFWLKSRLFQGKTNPIPPDADAFERIAFVVIKDADGVLKAWGTDELDPEDPLDTYSAASPDYVGTLSQRAIADGATSNGLTSFTSATAAFNDNDAGKLVIAAGIPVGTAISAIVSPTQVTLSAAATATATGLVATIGTPNMGLFAEGYPGAVSGRFALKAYCPPDAEQTVMSNSRSYTVYWGVLKNDQLIVDSEAFNVGPAAGLDFGGITLTVADVKGPFPTSLTDEQIEPMLTEAIDDVIGQLQDGGIKDPDAYFQANGGLPTSIRIAILEKARCAIARYDLAAGKVFTSIQEGTERISIAGKDLSTDLCASGNARVVQWLKKNAPGRQPMYHVVDKRVGHTVNHAGEQPPGYRRF